mmetsp:Transcript_7721/g.14257  ORF Transcript_7721/g.14257 Transcript_7721/m.14257 type:complete len:89 (+) Transcript_7721:2930-3196(+)
MRTQSNQETHRHSILYHVSRLIYSLERKGCFVGRSCRKGWGERRSEIVWTGSPILTTAKTSNLKIQELKLETETNMTETEPFSPLPRT